MSSSMLAFIDLIDVFASRVAGHLYITLTRLAPKVKIDYVTILDFVGLVAGLGAIFIAVSLMNSDSVLQILFQILVMWFIHRGLLIVSGFAAIAFDQVEEALARQEASKKRLHSDINVALCRLNAWGLGFIACSSLFLLTTESPWLRATAVIGASLLVQVCIWYVLYLAGCASVDADPSNGRKGGWRLSGLFNIALPTA